MADYKVTDTELTGIADAIRVKDGIDETMEFPNGFSSRIMAIPQGSGVQPDWEQDDDTADDYIKNKPANLVQDANYVHTDNNYTTAEKTKLDGVESGAEANVQADWNESDSTKDTYIANKPQNLVIDASYVHTDNNYTSTEKTKLQGISAGAEPNVQSDWSETDTSADDYIKNKPTIPDELADLADDSTHRLVTDAEKTTWNQKLDEEDLDVGQENADLIGADLANTLTLNSSYFSGTAKYDKIGDMVIVYVNVSSKSSQSANRRIESGAIPSANRPSSAVSEVCRSYPSASLRVTTDGYVYLDYNGTTIPSGTVIKGEVCYFV